MSVVSQLQASLATVKANLGSDDIINHLKAQFGDPRVQAKLADERVEDTQTLATDTISAYKSFDQAKSTLTQLGENKGSWPGRWESLFTDYIKTVRASLDVHKEGVSFFGGFNSDIVQNLDWDETHFEEAKALINKYLQNPAGSRLATGSSNASQRYTDNRRSVSQYQTDFSGFVSNMRDDNRQAQIRLQGDIDKLNVEIERYNSAGEKIKRALIEVAGIPSWMTWVISEILGVLGISSVEDARRALDANYAEQQRLKDERESVQKEIEQKNQMDADLARANDALTRLNRVITDIIPRLDSLAKEWANYHHDIVLIQQDMVAAGDSATKRSLITRLKLVGGSVDALVAGMKAYVKLVDGSGLFK